MKSKQQLKTRTHQLKFEDLMEFKNNPDTGVLYASSMEIYGLKRLYLTLNGGYKVPFNGNVVLECMQPMEAIEKYNEL